MVKFDPDAFNTLNKRRKLFNSPLNRAYAVCCMLFRMWPKSTKAIRTSELISSGGMLRWSNNPTLNSINSPAKSHVSNMFIFIIRISKYSYIITKNVHCISLDFSLDSQNQARKPTVKANFIAMYCLCHSSFNIENKTYEGVVEYYILNFRKKIWLAVYDCILERCGLYKLTCGFDNEWYNNLSAIFLCLNYDYDSMLVS